MEAGKSLLLVAPLHLLRLGLELQLVAVLDYRDLERRQRLHMQHLRIPVLLVGILEDLIQLVPRCAQLCLQQIGPILLGRHTPLQLTNIVCLHLPDFEGALHLEYLLLCCLHCWEMKRKEESYQGM